MPETTKQQGGSEMSNIYLAIIIMFILALMILPLPTFLMDVFLVTSITGALVILFVAIYIHNPLEFSVFPSLLLIVTLFRLSLNVSTTRLILSRGYAGEIIDSFGSFVIGGNYVVGVVIFLILVIINFVVITKGSGRIAEVSARFTLDAMPGKQMAIDADLNAGLVDDIEAQQRRQQIARESEFYGAMDGAAKFVRGDAIAGLLITTVNILGGLAIGVFQNGMGFAEAANRYTILTVGDGLVAQIPALIISTSAGIIITRATGESSMGIEISGQLSRQPRAAFVSAGVLLLMGLLPGLPFLPFSILSLGMGTVAYGAQKRITRELQEAEQAKVVPPDAESQERIEDYLHPDPFEIEIGYGLIPLVDKERGGNLLGRISMIRKSIAMEMGLIVPSIRIRDNIQLKSNQYVFKIYGIEYARGEVILDNFLVLNPDDRIELDGYETVEPTFGLPAIWIPKREKEKAEVAGYTVIEPPAIIATHLMEVLKANAYRLLDRQKTQKMLDHLKESHAAVVEGVVPDLISLGTITQILKNLLKEKIPIRNLVSILETIADYAAYSKDAEVLTEYVRKGLSDTITDHLKQDRAKLSVLTLDPRLEDHIMKTIKEGNGQLLNLGLEPGQVQQLFNSIVDTVHKVSSEGLPSILIVSPQIRKAVRNFVEPILPELSVVAYSELSAETEINSIGTIEYPNEA